MRRRPVLFVAGAAAVALRLATLGRGWHLDEFASLEVARTATFAQAMQAVRRDPHHPAFFALLWLWYRMGTARAWLRALPLAFDLFALALVGRALLAAPRADTSTLGRHPWRVGSAASTGGAAGAAPPDFVAPPLAPGLLAFGLYAANPLVLRFAAELRPYSALMCGSLCSYLALDAVLCAAPGARRPQFALAASTTAAVWLHPVGAFTAAAVLGTGVAVAPGRARALVWPALPCAASFLALHWGFTLDPSAARIGWMPQLSGELFVRIVGVCFGLEDSAQYGTLARWLYLGGAGGMMLVAWLGVQASWAPARLRPAAVAAGALLLSVSAYSLVAQPIFWYRSLAPAVVLLLLAAGAGIAARAGRATCGVAAALLGLHLAGFLPIAGRAVDPAEVAAQRALAVLGAQEPLYVYPDWMDTTLRALATPAVLARVRPLTNDFPAAPGVLLVRCNLGLLGAPGGLAELLAQLPPQAAPFRHVVAIHDDNDDLSGAAMADRRQLLAALIAAQPRCRVVSDGAARLAELACDGRNDPPAAP